MRMPLVIYDFAPDPSEFPYVWGHFYFLFYQWASLTCTWRSTGWYVPDGVLDDSYLTEPWMTPTSRSMEWMTCSYSNLQTENNFYGPTHSKIPMYLLGFGHLLLSCWEGSEQRRGWVTYWLPSDIPASRCLVLYRAVAMTKLAICRKNMLLLI